MQLALPTHLQPNGRVCFYGYGGLEDWLMDHAKTRMKEDTAEYDHRALMAAALQIPKVQAHIRNLVFVDPTAPTNTTIIPPHRFGGTVEGSPRQTDCCRFWLRSSVLMR